MLNVKTIFKVLIGTPLIITLTFLFVEIINVNVTSPRLNSMCKMSASMACDTFSLESYRTGDESLPDIESETGVYVSGNFYPNAIMYSGTSTEEKVYKSLYNSTEFTRFLQNSIDCSDWEFTQALAVYKGITSMSNSDDQEYMYELGKQFMESLVTPSNLNIAYLDSTAVSRMYRWNLTQILSNCNQEAIRTDSTGTYVIYNGFKCYTNLANITNITYKTYDVSTTNGAKEFYKDTNIAPVKYANSVSGVGDGIDFSVMNNKVCVAEIGYSMPVAYKGVTPLQNLLSWVWNNEVDGFNGSSSSAPTSDDMSLSEVEDSFNVTQEITSDIPEGCLPTTGKLVFYVIQ